ncbi:MAG: hypothetical protein FD153_391, partial [Rhodospirillaceae bacterium]
GGNEVLITAFFRGVGQMADSRLRAIALRGVGISVVTYMILWGGVSWLLAATTVLSIGWMETLVDVAGSLAAFALSLLFFPAFVSTVIGFFLEDVIQAVEARHYPNLPPVRHRPPREIVWEGIRYAGVLIAVNLLALPLYVLVPFINLLVFFVLNGYLLGREYYELVALRRLSEVDARKLWIRGKRSLWMAGGVIAGLLAIPGVNVLAPIMATAFMVHVFEDLQRRKGG